MTPGRTLGGVLALALLGLGLTAEGQEPPSADGWRPFEGTWSASGRRQTIPVEGGARAAVVELSGAIVLRAGEGLSRGFAAETIAFDDGEGKTVGRGVWTDERGDRVFSRLTGEPLAAGRRIQGTITGGTGRYAGLEGEYSFAWQYLLASEDGVIQGRTGRLTGRVRRGDAK